MTFLSSCTGLRISAVSRWSPCQPQKERPMDRVAGPQLLNFWYSCRTPLSWTLAGMVVGVMVGVGVRVGVAVGPAVGVEVTVGVGEAMVARTMAATVALGVKTASSGGSKKYLISARSRLSRQATRSWKKGSW